MRYPNVNGMQYPGSPTKPKSCTYRIRAREHTALAQQNSNEPNALAIPAPPIG